MAGAGIRKQNTVSDDGNREKEEYEEDSDKLLDSFPDALRGSFGLWKILRNEFRHRRPDRTEFQSFIDLKDFFITAYSRQPK